MRVKYVSEILIHCAKVLGGADFQHLLIETHFVMLLPCR